MRRNLLLIGALAGSLCLAAGCSGSDQKTTETTQQTQTSQMEETHAVSETAASTEKAQSASESTEVKETSAVNLENTAVQTLVKTDYLADQAVVDEQLLAETKKDYSIDNPLVVVNPYGNSPLTAIAIFKTDTPTGVKVVVEGKKPEDNIEGKFDSETVHILPIYGLYAGGETNVTFTLDDNTSKTVAVTTDNIETTMANAEVTTMEADSYDFSKLTIASGGAANEAAAYDSSGDIRWYFKTAALPIKLLANGHFITQSNILIEPLYYMSGIMEFDLIGKVYNDYSIPGGSHHAIYEMSNGNLLVGSCSTDFSKVEDRIVEIDKNTGEIVYELQLEDLLDPTDGSSMNRTDKDWFHNNAIWYDEATDTILLSGRHVDAVVGIDKTNKSLKWILGDPEGWTTVDPKYFFTPTGDNFEWQFAQHNVTVLPNGDIMVFDNGSNRTKSTKPDEGTKGDDVYSRAVIYRIDTEKMSIEQVWQYGKERGAEWYSSFISGASYLGENEYWITSGGVLYDTINKTYDMSPFDQASKDVEKTAYLDQVKDDKLVFELKIPSLIYRSIRVPMYLENSKSLDLTAKGKWLGDLGETKTVETKVDVKTAAAADPAWTWKQTPSAVTFAGVLKLDDIKAVKDSYIVLQDEKGEQKTYAVIQTPIPGEDGAGTLSMSGFISSTGLEGQKYHIYIQANGTLYDSGYEAQF